MNSPIIVSSSNTTLIEQPTVQLDFPGMATRVLTISEIEEATHTRLDPANVSDDQLKTLVAQTLDRPASDLNALWVRRPATGNIVIGPKPSYG